MQKMRRTMGLCVVAVFAISAILAASASAETFPSYKVCAKAAKVGKLYTGRYNQKNCTEVNVKGEGKYELEPWTAAKLRSFTGKNGASVFDAYIKGTGILASIACKKGTDVGEVTGESTSTEVTKFEGCTGAGSTCTSPEAKTGEIVTDTLVATLVTLKEETETEAGVVGLDLAGTGGEQKDLTAEFKCGTYAVKTTGSALGVVSGDMWVSSKGQTDTFAVNKAGENEYNHKLGGIEGEDTLFSEIKGLGRAETGEQAVAVLKEKTAWDIEPRSEPLCCSCHNPDPC